MSEKSGSKKSLLFKPPNRNIFIFIKIHIQEGPIKMDPKNPKNHWYPHFDGSWTHIHVSEKYGSKKSWLLKSSNRNIFIFIKIHIQEGPITRDPKTRKTDPAATSCCGWEERAIYGRFLPATTFIIIWSYVCFVGRSFIMCTSHLQIFMIFGIFLFEDLTHQDFLDSDFSDTCMWVQDPSKRGYP